MLVKKNNMYADIRLIIQNAQNTSVRSVNFTMVLAYWKIGERIVEDEQNGNKRATYGEGIIPKLAVKLSKAFGKGFDEREVRKFRQFYTLFAIRDAVRPELPSIKKTLKTGKKKSSALHTSNRNSAKVKASLVSSTNKLSIRDAVRPELEQSLLRTELSWTHYRLLLSVENSTARNYYMNETADNNWNTRMLERQIHSFYYERLLSSKNKNPLLKKTQREAKKDNSTILDFIKDPYVLEFLTLQPNATLYEKQLETELLNKLQQFLLELGKGFSFVARQKRVSADGENFFIDLVFYNYILRCFVLIDLKAGKLSHQDIGQMDFYVRYYEEEMKQAADNPTIGIILCAEKNEAIAKYSVLNENKRLFASKYKLYLPTEKELAKELEFEINRYNRKKNK